MKNRDFIKRQCNAIANTFYPDDSAVEVMLYNEGVDADGEAQPKDKTLFRIAVRMVIGYVESSRGEGGVSVGIDREAVKNSIRIWANYFEDDVEELIADTTVEDKSSMW